MRRMSRRRRARPRARIVAAVVAAAALAAVIAYLVWPRSDPRTGSLALPDVRLDIGRRTLESYRITYRLEIPIEGKVSVSRTTTVVRRPFEGREDDTVSSFTRQAIRGSGFWVPPGPPEMDRRPDAVLREAVRDGYADARERRRVAGRTCRVYRIGAPSSSPSLPRLRDSDTQTDVCVDEAGLILEEVAYDDEGGITRRRVAERVTEQPEVDDDTLDVRKPKGDPRQIGSVQQMEDDSRLPGGTFWVLGREPKGFSFEGRYSIVPAGQPGFTDPTARGSVITFVSEVWTDGTDILVIDQGATQGDPPFGEDTDAREHPALGLLEQRVRPVDGRPQTPVAFDRGLIEIL
jgi:hypothetical protein